MAEGRAERDVMSRIERVARGGLRFAMTVLGMISFAFLGGALVVILTSGDLPTAASLAIVGVLVGIPPKYDPVVRWKERLERR